MYKKILFIICLIVIICPASYSLQTPLKSMKHEFRIFYRLEYYVKEATGLFSEELKEQNPDRYIDLLTWYATQRQTRFILCKRCAGIRSVFQLFPIKPDDGKIIYEGVCGSCKEYKGKANFNYWSAAQVKSMFKDNKIIPIDFEQRLKAKTKDDIRA